MDVDKFDSTLGMASGSEGAAASRGHGLENLEKNQRAILIMAAFGIPNSHRLIQTECLFGGPTADITIIDTDVSHGRLCGV
jgi:hypothetical protein